MFVLRVSLTDVMPMQTRQVNLEDAAETPLRRVVKEALRIRASRLVVGEARISVEVSLRHMRLSVDEHSRWPCSACWACHPVQVSTPRPVSTSWPVPGLDPRTALATSMAASPGVYAVLLGSGVSSAAGIKTGFGVVQDLVRIAARAQGADLGDLADAPEVWWREQTGTEPRYDDLLDNYASTDLARRALLRQYFDVPTSQATPAHHHLGRLVADGLVRVVITTNFDQLAERSIEAAGIVPQVIADVAGIRGMLPLQHAPATVLKPHGDFANTPLRNTPDELASYEEQWVTLLDRVFDEYGLIVVGWSAAWDTALVDTLRQVRSRRYPTFWTHRGKLHLTADRLATVRAAQRVPIISADAFFIDLRSRLDRIVAASARRGPFRLGPDLLIPAENSPPAGWSAEPLLKVTVLATLTGVPVDQLGVFRTRDRDRLLTTLASSPLTGSLTALRDVLPTADAQAGIVSTSPIKVPDGEWSWHRNPMFAQGGSAAGFRLGGAADRGVGALCSVSLPPSARGGDSVAIAVNVAVSASVQLSPLELGKQLRHAIQLAAIDLPDALEPLLSAGAEVARLDIRLSASTDTGHGFHRPNNMDDRVDWSPLGVATRTLTSAMGVGVTVSQALANGDLTELTVLALERMTIEAGFDDPDDGVSALRRGLAHLDTPHTDPAHPAV